MPRKVRELKADLRRAGFVLQSGKWSHTKWSHPALPGRRVIISGNDGDDAQPYQERELREALASLLAALKGQS